MNHPQPIDRIVDDVALEMERAMIFGAFLDSLSAPSLAQLWLEEAAAKLRAYRDADGSKKQKRDKIVIRLLARDGSDCFYCGKHLGEDVTLEHLTPLALGGSWADDNLALAHRGCNHAAGHLTRFEKETLRKDHSLKRELDR